jgi:glycosyltransferase involved in cell wall biosynthesis
MSKNELLVITSFPPRECGIATYSQDLVNAIEDKYSDDLTIKLCALRTQEANIIYPSTVSYFLDTWLKDDYTRLAMDINADESIKLILLQHEFGLFDGINGDYLIDFLEKVEIPVITTFHTILPHPTPHRKELVSKIAILSRKMIVMTSHSANILNEVYSIAKDKIKIIPHGTHLIKPRQLKSHQDKPYADRIILSTFGLISEGKSIETALDALPRIIKEFPNVLYLVIGKTHPEVVKKEGEQYREYLHKKVKQLGLEQNVLFINKYLSLGILLDYLERTDIYLFTSKDPQQAVSGTLAYAMAAGCPIISTPIPHALELLDGAGINFDFQDAHQLADAAILLLSNPQMMNGMHMNALHKISPTAWQNSAIAHIELAKSVFFMDNCKVSYRVPKISLEHVKRMTTDFGMLQFSVVAKPDESSGYTLDDNARALISTAKNFELSGDFEDLDLINTYLKFILYCQQEDGSFLNYVRHDQHFYKKNQLENLEDANGRAIWALGEFLSMQQLMSLPLQAKVEAAFQGAMTHMMKLKSPRAIAFSIKGLYYYNQFKKHSGTLKMITSLADNLVSKYRGVSNENWKWFESYLTYANAVLPEAMLLAGICTNSKLFKETAKKTFDFLLSITHKEEVVSVISNIGRHQEGEARTAFGEQPIEYAYTILALDYFYEEYNDEAYLNKMKVSFNWFLGDNHLQQIIYNPCTGGCYDGLEEDHVNLNQGAESTLSYLLARLTMGKHI